jgi:competence ComEA-like helix-hairpin-helix protein
MMYDVKQFDPSEWSSPPLEGRIVDRPGVGKIMAEQIVAYREQYGSFRRIEHLMMVHGFSDHKFRALRELITVE